jgi:hypothetical protein
VISINHPWIERETRGTLGRHHLALLILDSPRMNDLARLGDRQRVAAAVVYGYSICKIAFIIGHREIKDGRFKEPYCPNSLDATPLYNYTTSMIRQQPHRSETYRRKAEAKVNVTWPGGTQGAIADYQAEHASLAMISNTTGVAFRSLRRIFIHYGATLRNRQLSILVGYRIHPEWSERTAAKLRKSSSFFRPDVKQRCVAARVATIRANPGLHPNAKVKMSYRESLLAAILSSFGVLFQFNANAGRYWLDFLLPELNVGVELQRSQVRPSWNRDRVIRDILGLDTIFYVPGRWFNEGRTEYLKTFIADLKCRRINPASLGEYRMICCKSKRTDTRYIDGHYFRRRWSEVRLNYRLPSSLVGQHDGAHANVFNCSNAP